MKQSGLYVITFNTAKILFVGFHEDIEKKLKSHFKHLQKRDHYNIFLQNAYDFYGINDMTYTVVQLCDKKSIPQLKTMLPKLIEHSIMNENFNKVYACF